MPEISAKELIELKEKAFLFDLYRLRDKLAKTYAHVDRIKIHNEILATTTAYLDFMAANRRTEIMPSGQIHGIPTPEEIFAKADKRLTMELINQQLAKNVSEGEF